MRKPYLFVLLLAICFSCSEKQEDRNNTTQPYFNFDKITHYKNDIAENDIYMLYDKPDKSANDSLYLEIVEEDMPVSIQDTIFINSLEEFGFIKNDLNRKDYSKIKEIFSFKKHDQVSETLCIPVYRDIFVFKKNNKIIGIAKICFECGMNHIIGTNIDTREFGQSGDYERLNEILNPEMHSESETTK